MALRGDIQSEKDRIKLRFGYGAELKSLESVLFPDEAVERMIFGKNEKARGLIVLTNLRVLFHYKVPTVFTTESGLTFPLKNVTSVHSSTKGLSSNLTLTVAGSAVTFSEVPRQLVDDFVRATNRHILTAQ